MTLVFSTVFGLLMVAAVAAPADGAGLVVTASAGIAVIAGLRVRSAATLAVLLTVLAIAISDPSPLLVAVSGLSAAAYILVRHAVGASAVDTTTWPSVVGAVGFTTVTLIVAAVPVQLPWLPLAAPLAAVAIYLLALRPYLTSRM
ncbi:hypothetical protein [Mycobacterium hubeiense]|uniref:hypothetical protein n=1 Tax=Mycobacterium hubeiense TaxID=1867256 RepID=UPI000C7EB4CD|nr:hypothetical protein [Mycobacterium sp. QGD 101]